MRGWGGEGVGRISTRGQEQSLPPPLKGVLKLLVVLVQYFQYSKYKALTFSDFGAWVLFKSVTQCGRIIYNGQLSTLILCI